MQPREVARKAVSEIKKTPPRLFAYSIAGALGVIVLIVSMIAWRNHSENSEDEGSTEQPAATAASHASHEAGVEHRSASHCKSSADRGAGAYCRGPRTERGLGRAEIQSQEVKAAPVSAPTAIPGQLTINSTPEGAEVHIDGRTDPSWVTPFNLPGLAPGQHSVTVARAGYSTESRNIDVASGSKSFLVVQLAQVTAMVAATSEPAGAQLFIDGKDTGRVTPVQIPVDKPGPHTFLVRKQGYLEETSTANLQAGQIFHFAPSLKALGSTDDIKVGGEIQEVVRRRRYGWHGILSIKTQPKGAQVAINNRIMDKFSPVDLFLNPGTYVVDVTMSGYKRIHRVDRSAEGWQDCDG